MKEINPIFAELIDLIFSNKELPYYSAERRIDPILEMFIEPLLTQKYGSKVEFISPEFPLRQWSTNSSNEVDYLCKYESTILYVELKTDIKSYDEDQLNNYIDNCNWGSVIENLRKKINNKNVSTDDRVKYYKLIKRLFNKDVIKINKPESLLISDSTLAVKNHRDKMVRTLSIKNVVNSIEACDLDVKILYIGPENQKFRKLLNSKKVDFIPLDSLKDYTIATPYLKEWKLFVNKF